MPSCQPAEMSQTMVWRCFDNGHNMASGSAAGAVKGRSSSTFVDGVEAAGCKVQAQGLAHALLAGQGLQGRQHALSLTATALAASLPRS